MENGVIQCYCNEKATVIHWQNIIIIIIIYWRWHSDDGTDEHIAHEEITTRTNKHSIKASA